MASGESLTQRPIRGRALFDFDPSPDYPEQVVIKKDETFRVVEDYRDGWTSIKKRNGTKGVIPTSYYVQIRLTFKEQAFDWLQLAGEQLWALIELVIRTVLNSVFLVLSFIGKELHQRIYTPALEYTLKSIKNNETAQTFLSSVSRRIHSAVLMFFLKDMTTEELATNIEEVEEYVQRTLRQERSRIPASRSSFEVIANQDEDHGVEE